MTEIHENKQLEQLNEQESPKKEASTSSVQARLIEILSPLLSSLGYDVVHVEALNQRQKILRIYIDHLNSTATHGTVGIGDCVKVTKALDEPLELLPEISAIFKGSYELEVSSPGVDRPLRQLKDFERFKDRQARIHLFRPLSAEEIENPSYQQKNPKQKNFLGVLKGIDKEKIVLMPTDLEAELKIPLNLISKANLEPVFDFEGDK